MHVHYTRIWKSVAWKHAAILSDLTRNLVQALSVYYNTA